ncbi:MAG: YfhO family protein [Lachnospiraceae bacterium]|uniref:YfhO family protein n=1 Tax=uncultured Acetatifactor sp. TaxID=1671927 RepID=UPI002614799F|nr:YfhO family protein [uncultured Acetatifactor sp.]MCI8787840.1 YfhO family protein [Lachnospiraceae bacterium]
MKKMKQKTRGQWERAVLVLSLLIPTIIMLALFVINRIYPFGDRSFLFSDMYHQYMPFFSELLHKVRGGESLSFSFNVGIGSNFLALFVYYLASPFHIFSLLVPESHLMEFMSYLIVLKIGLAGLTSYLYLKKHFQAEDAKDVGDAPESLWTKKRGNDIGALFFSCFYALSGFMAAYNYNIMWVDCVVLLPLIVLGLERLVKEGRGGLYCVTLALSIFTNYYISIMICIFLVLYFILLLALEKDWVHNIWKKGIPGYFALYSLLAGGMAAVLLIPEVCAILRTDFGDMDFPKKVESYFSVLDMLARHCMCVYTERGLDHWPNIYCGSAVLLMVPLYLMNRRISIREKFCRMALAGFLLISFSTNVLDFIWHGLNYPDSLPARQSFLYIFLVLTMCYEAFRGVREMEGQQILYSFLWALGFILFCGKFIDHEDFELGVKLLTLVFAGVYAVLLYLYRTRQKRMTLQAVAVAALVMMVAESAINTYGTSVGTVSRSAYLGQQEDYKALYEVTRTREEGFYRLEKFTRKTKNDGTLTGYPTASVFSSTLNSYVMDMYQRLGMRHSKVYYGFDGATALVSAMLNVNYMFGESEKYENSLYTLLGQSGDVFLYQCNALLPFGYVAPLGFDLPEGFEGNGLLLQNQMAEDLGAEGMLFRPVRAEAARDDVVFTAQEGGYYYAVLTASGTNKVDCIGGSTDEEKFKDLKKGSVLYLGYLEKGQTITLTNGNEEDETPRVDADVYAMDREVLGQVLELLSAQHMEHVVWESDFLSGDITMAQAGRLILSVPYEAGWKVLVNGEEVEGALFGGCLMAFDLEPGEYRFEMKYVPEGSYAGAAVSAVSIVAFAMIQTIRRRRKPSAEPREA